MDFDLNADQAAILEAVEALLERYAGPERAVGLRGGKYDHELERALRDAGFNDVALSEGTGLLEAGLVTEAVARAGGLAATGASVLVAAELLGELPEGPIALATAGAPGPVRYAAHARTLLVSDGDVARRLPLEVGDVAPVASNFGYPFGRVSDRQLSSGESLGPGSGERLRSLWRLTLALEAVGTMRAALSVTTEYLKERRQFGKHIGSFQAVQHRLAECAIEIEASRWLALEAAYLGAPREAAAVAATYALEAAGRTFAETHQLSGAIGFTREHDLHVWSMRLPALRLEHGGAANHAREVAAARWSSPT